MIVFRSKAITNCRTWYPANATRLAAAVDSYIQQAAFAPIDGDVLGVITPHAGYRYSGRTAGYAFRAVQGLEVDLVVVVSPFHNYHPESFVTTAHEAYWTPLGEIPVDRVTLETVDESLIKECGKGLAPVANDLHSLEMHFLSFQRSYRPFQLLP